MLFAKDIIPENFDYKDYFLKNSFRNHLGISDTENDISQKTIYDPTFRVQKNNKIPLPAELDDLCRLHYLATSRKVTTILEFGVGKSTVVLADALNLNKESYFEYTNKSLRRNNLYEIHSVDNFQKWINTCKDLIPSNFLKNKSVFFHHSKVDIGLFLDRICTYYDPLPNICPDLIYLDGPFNYSDTGEIRGISTNHQDRVAMSGDILAIEHFLQPGTLIIIDGRTANARFLKCNLQRNWGYYHSQEWDQHFFELQEPPLGIYNKTMIDHCLGESFYKRI